MDTTTAPLMPIAIADFLAAPMTSTGIRPRALGTVDTYAGVLRLLHASASRSDRPRPPFGPDDPVSLLGVPAGQAALLSWFCRRYADSAPATWNKARAAVSSACAWWQQQGWVEGNPADELEVRAVVRPLWTPSWTHTVSTV